MLPLEQIAMITSISATLLLSVWVFIIHRRIQKLLAGKNAQSLEYVIGKIGNDITSLKKFREETMQSLIDLDKRVKRSIQGVETIRFNAFSGNGEGGNQSFAIALLSENGDGTIISSLYSRDRMSVFAKPVKKFISEYGMTAEEEGAVSRTRVNK